jgi:hypothetical protein
MLSMYNELDIRSESLDCLATCEKLMKIYFDEWEIQSLSEISNQYAMPCWDFVKIMQH